MQVGMEPNRQNDRVNNHLGWEGKIRTIGCETISSDFIVSIL